MNKHTCFVLLTSDISWSRV